MAEKILNRFGQEIELIALNTEISPAIVGITETTVQGALGELLTLSNNVNLTAITDGYRFTKADNTTVDTIFTLTDVTTSNPKLTITVGGTLVKTIPLNQNSIDIDAGDSEWDLTDDIVTIKNNDGTTIATLDFSKYNVTSSVNVTTGATEFFQNGNLIATIPVGGIEEEETFSATLNQTTFTLAFTPKGKVHFFRNGIKLNTTATTLATNVVTYVPANNGANNLALGDRITIIYEK